MRIRRLLASVALAGTLLAALAGGGAAEANPDHANCVGQELSSGNVTSQDIVAFNRQYGGIGHYVGGAASSNAC